jgi:hypothetical protein
MHGDRKIVMLRNTTGGKITMDFEQSCTYETNWQSKKVTLGIDT